MRARCDRVRSDGNWISGDPDHPGTPGKEGSMLLAYHLVGADPLPDFPGWDTPRYGFARPAPGNLTVMCMTYHPTRRPAPVQLSLFTLKEGP